MSTVRQIKYRDIPALKEHIKDFETVVETNDYNLYAKYTNFCCDTDVKMCRPSEDAYNDLQDLYQQLHGLETKLKDIKINCTHDWDYRDGMTPDNFKPHEVCEKCLSVRIL